MKPENPQPPIEQGATGGDDRARARAAKLEPLIDWMADKLIDELVKEKVAELAKEKEAAGKGAES